jgi:hypothetical protein
MRADWVACVLGEPFSFNAGIDQGEANPRCSKSIDHNSVFYVGLARVTQEEGARCLECRTDLLCEASHRRPRARGRRGAQSQDLLGRLQEVGRDLGAR